MKKKKIAEKFKFFEPHWIPCDENQIKGEVQWFISNFIIKHLRRRMNYFLERGRYMTLYSPWHLDERYYKTIGGQETFPQCLVKKYGNLSGVYIGDKVGLLKLAEAVSVAAFFEDALFLVRPRLLAFCFNHHGGSIILCEKSIDKLNVTT